MKPAHEKYIPFVPLKMARRAWPDRELKAPPVWCSVDLRDGKIGRASCRERVLAMV